MGSITPLSVVPSLNPSLPMVPDGDWFCERCICVNESRRLSLGSTTSFGAGSTGDYDFTDGFVVPDSVVDFDESSPHTRDDDDVVLPAVQSTIQTRSRDGSRPTRPISALPPHRRRQRASGGSSRRHGAEHSSVRRSPTAAPTAATVVSQHSPRTRQSGGAREAKNNRSPERVEPPTRRRLQRLADVHAPLAAPSTTAHVPCVAAPCPEPPATTSARGPSPLALQNANSSANSVRRSPRLSFGAGSGLGSAVSGRDSERRSPRPLPSVLHIHELDGEGSQLQQRARKRGRDTPAGDGVDAAVDDDGPRTRIRKRLRCDSPNTSVPHTEGRTTPPAPKPEPPLAASPLCVASVFVPATPPRGPVSATRPRTRASPPRANARAVARPSGAQLLVPESPMPPTRHFSFAQPSSRAQSPAPSMAAPAFAFSAPPDSVRHRSTSPPRRTRSSDHLAAAETVHAKKDVHMDPIQEDLCMELHLRPKKRTASLRLVLHENFGIDVTKDRS